MLRALLHILSTLRHRLEIARYNDYTIAEYFRGQGAKIGDHCQIMIRKLGSEPFLIHIGNNCTIAPEVELITHDGGAWMFTDELPSLQSFGRIDILDNCFIGQRAIVMPGIRIGPRSVVGAGAIVTKDVPPNTVVAGSPAREVSTLEEYRAKLMRIWERQRPSNGYLEDLKAGQYYPSAYIQRRRAETWSQPRAHLERLFA